MPEIAVSIPARNAAPYIGAALRSVLAGQQAVDLEVVVVDDASADGTADAARALGDPRVRVVRSPVRRGIGWCHNEALRRSSAPVVVHVDADDVVRPGALPRMLAALRADEGAGQAYCDFVVAGADAVATEELEARARRHFALARREPIDHRRQLLVHGMVVNHLRTYRRAALEEVGGFDESLPWAVDYEMALRLAERWRFVRVPEVLYVTRVLETGASERVRAKRARFWWMRWRLARRALARGEGRVLGYSTARAHLLLLAGLADAAGASDLLRRSRA